MKFEVFVDGDFTIEATDQKEAETKVLDILDNLDIKVPYGFAVVEVTELK